jgi:hypothetical protein
MLKLIITAAAMAISVYHTNTDKLTGRWETQPSPTGNVFGVVFKEDLSLEGYQNKKPFFTGSYSLENDIIHFVDNGCPDVKASYKLVFFSNDDSLRFEPIEDNCEQRLAGMKRTILGRVKK